MPSDSQREFLERASRKYHDEITPEGVEYLTGRGITEEAIGQWRLGVVSDPLPGHERYRGWLSIPYLTKHGIVTIRYRRLSGTGDKYLTMPGDIPRIFNPSALEAGTRGICVTEGELDCIVAQMCDLPCIGLPGATSWQPVWAYLLEQYDQVMLLQDADDAGEKMAAALAKPLRTNLRPVVMTGGDVNSYFQAHGREALRTKVLG
ncbi:toprim domain-containing protein [Actinomadura oligospora]|uniref:toprim domain-containing protein n=1 Tax=Actinomadura oligospora TaxID=111804 RepID=UPI001FE01432|nr:toprim domain-containing protein [Actinomadura oligospora]